MMIFIESRHRVRKPSAIMCTASIEINLLSLRSLLHIRFCCAVCSVCARVCVHMHWISGNCAVHGFPFSIALAGVVDSCLALAVPFGRWSFFALSLMVVGAVVDGVFSAFAVTISVRAPNVHRH